jgi:hypothetical protein
MLPSVDEQVPPVAQPLPPDPRQPTSQVDPLQTRPEVAPPHEVSDAHAAVGMLAGAGARWSIIEV